MRLSVASFLGGAVLAGTLGVGIGYFVADNNRSSGKEVSAPALVEYRKRLAGDYA